MIIRIMYQNEKYDFVKPFLLDELIYFNKIKKFLRSEGWVDPGVDKIRGMGGYYRGPERRKTSDTASAGNKIQEVTIYGVPKRLGQDNDIFI